MFDSFSGKWEQMINAIDKLLIDMQQDIMQVNDKLIQLCLDVEQVHQYVVGEDEK